jgi:hypothetical protein
MADVRFVDTSVLCDLLKVPGKCQKHEEVLAELEALVKSGVQLVLPIGSVIETGNHIAQAAGSGRRASAEAFVKVLRLTANGGAPWVLHSVAWDGRMLELICDGPEQVGAFVDIAGNGTMGAGDVAILAECALFSARTAGVDVKVWTHDVNLAAYT